MSTNEKRTNRLRLGLGIFQIFIGVGAVAGGLGFILDPTGESMGMTSSWLAGSIFPDFLIPGIVLFTVNGLGTLIGATLTLSRRTYAGIIAVLLGIFMMLWIVVQVLVIGYSTLLQPTYFVIGILELILGIQYSRRSRSMHIATEIKNITP